jgi:Leucine-rich repeat (LRR) protein
MSDFVVDFPDWGLDQAVRSATGKPTGDIMMSDLEGLTTLHADDYGIADFTGIEYCRDLTTLVLTNNDFSDLSGLEGLSRLVSLQLSMNEVVDIGVLAGLVNLDSLDLASNYIRDIHPLVQNSGLGSGDYVDLTSNSDLSGASCSTHIPELEARGATVKHDCP